MDVSVKIEGVDELVQRFGNLQMHNILRAPMSWGLLEIQAALQEYPVARPNSNYIRTTRLGKAWTHRIYTEPGAIYGVVGNNVEYAPFVQNYQFQAKVHKRRWLTDKAAVTQFRPGIVADFQRTIQRALEG